VVWLGDSPRATLLVLESNTVNACSALWALAISCMFFIEGAEYNRITLVDVMVSARIIITPTTADTAFSDRSKFLTTIKPSTR
jgi:hypothetical protein